MVDTKKANEPADTSGPPPVKPSSQGSPTSYSSLASRPDLQSTDFYLPPDPLAARCAAIIMAAYSQPQQPTVAEELQKKEQKPTDQANKGNNK